MNWIVVSIFGLFALLAAVLAASFAATAVKAVALSREVRRRLRAGTLSEEAVRRAAAKARDLSGASRKTQRVVLAVAAGGGLLLLGIAYSLFHEAFLMRSRSGHAAGVVTGFMPAPGGNAYARVSFAPSPSEQVTFTMKVGAAGPFAYREGDAVSVLFDPIQPGSARVDSFSQLWFVPLFVALFGSVLVLVTALFFAATAHERSRLALESGAGAL